MSNVFGLNNLKDDQKEGGNGDDQEGNRYYVGGTTGSGGGSGLSVVAPSSNDPFANIISQASSSGANGSNPNQIRIICYANGFTIGEEGNFRPLSDPANQPFLRDLEKGIVPRELEQQQHQHVDVALIDRRTESYQIPSYSAFSGEGQSLNSTTKTPDCVMMTQKTQKSTTLPELDEQAAKTTIQIRLHNGNKIKHTFNLTNTVQDIQTLIAVNGAGEVPYMLLSGFPPKPLTDASLTIQDAQLQGALINQKLA